MSSIPNPATRPPSPPGAPLPVRQTSDQVRQGLHQHLQKTASFIKFMDGLGVVFAWLAVLLLLWLAACGLDHWLWPLPRWGRWGCWLVGVAASAWWLGWRLIPLVIGRINPVYAARRIEQLVPEFKNGLIAWLELESLPDHGVPRGVMAALAYRAARFLGGQDPSATVDTSPLIKTIGVVLLLSTGLVLYTMLSPKSTFVTGQRILFPWSNIPPPTRVQILELTPGAIELTQGKPLAVEVTLKGLRSDDQVAVVYSTRDGQIVQQRVPLEPRTAGFRYAGQVTTDGQGVQQPLDYWIEAGDARHGPLAVSLSPLPAVVLQSVELQYPAYTQLEPRTIRGEKIEAIEGTRAIVRAQANQALSRGRLELNPSVDEAGELVRAEAFWDMAIDGRQLQLPLTLELDAAGSNPTLMEFRIRGYNQRGDANQRPITHALHVLADVPPEVNLLGPEDRLLRVRPTSRVNLEVRASDPDFGLTRLSLSLSRNGVPAPEIVLLQSPGVLGRQVKTHTIDLGPLRPNVGEMLEIVAIAADNRHDPRSQLPAPNLTRSQPLVLLVVAPEMPADVPPAAEPPADPAAPDPAAPDPAAPDAAGQQTGDQQTGDQQTGDQQTGDQQTGDQQTGDQQTGGQQSGGQEAGGQQAGGQQAGGQQAGGQQAGGQQAGGQQAGGQQAGDQQAGGQEAGGQEAGGQQAGGQQAGGQQAGSQNTAGQGGAQPGSSSGDGAGQAGSPSQPNASPQPGSPGGQPSAANDGQPASDGEAIRRVSEYMRSQPASQPSATAPAESSTQGTPPSAEQPSSNPSEGNSSEGNQPNPPQADSSQGNPSQGNQSQGNQSQDNPSQGNPSQGNPSQGNPSQGNPSQGNPSQGNPSQGNQSQGNQSQGNQSQANQSQNNQSQNNQSQSNQSQGNPSQGSPSQGNPSQGNQASGKPAGEKPPSATEPGSSAESSSPAESTPGSGSQKASPPEPAPDNSPSQSAPPAQPGNSQPSGSESSGSESSGSKPSGSESSDSKSSGSQPSGSESSGSESSGSQSSGAESSGPSAGESSSSSSSSSSGESGGQGASSEPSSASSGRGSSQSPAGGSGSGVHGGEGGSSGQRDAADREFAEQTTQMVLDYLNRQKDQPDPELLRELDWTPQDMQRFVQRWNQARDLADSPNPADRQRWSQMLEDLNLTAADAQLRQGSGRNDNFQQQRDSGGRMRFPASLQKQFDAYRQAMERAR